VAGVGGRAADLGPGPTLALVVSMFVLIVGLNERFLRWPRRSVFTDDSWGGEGLPTGGEIGCGNCMGDCVESAGGEISARNWGNLLANMGLSILIELLLAFFLGVVVHDVALLTSQRIVDAEHSRLARNRLHNGLNALLELLLIKSHARDGERRNLLLPRKGHSKVEALKLLSCSSDTDQLLLQALLLRSKEQIG
jgi:hypothetical protein